MGRTDGHCREIGRRLVGNLRSRADPRALLWVLPLLVALVHFTRPTYYVSPDTSHYLVHAMHIYMGEGYVNVLGEPVISRGPMFPALLGVGFAVNGVSVPSAYAVIVAFAILSVIAIHAVGQYLFDRWVGFLAALFVASSPVVRRIALNAIDVVFAVFLLGAVLAVGRAADRPTRRTGGVAGAVLGLSYLVKESAIVLIPLIGVAALLHDHRSRDVWQCVGGYITGLVATVGSWLIYNSLRATGGGWAAGGSRSQTVVSVLLGDQPFPIGVLLTVLRAGVDWGVQTATTYTLGPLLCLSWLYACWYVWHRRDKSVVLVAAAVLYSPLIVFTLAAGWRRGQFLVVDLLSFVAAAVLLVNAARVAVQRLPVDAETECMEVRVSLAVILVVASAGTAGILVSVGGDESATTVVSTSTVVSQTTGDAGTIQYTGRHGYGTAGTPAAAHWIRAHTDSDTQVMTTEPGMANELYFESRGRARRVVIPRVIASYSETGGNRTVMNVRGLSPANTSSEHVLWLTANQQSTGGTNEKLLVYTQEDVLAAIEANDVPYVVTGSNWEFYGTYFREHPAFETEATFSDGAVTVFRVTDRPLEPIEFRPRVTRLTTRYLEAIDSDDPRDTWIREHVFADLLGWDESEIAAIRRGDDDSRFVWIWYN